ncbi:TIR domain-containing protein [Sphingomonas sp. NSE70-1]|uniref:TIR domain-containing protein n=1 Tax=Sphingomonas caseinilyticus TaxID=2908205 RepID=A0ABT0RWM1_9SPHN|nr:TIR domain-containing protein [Sphingomonas caseinilyticus]MCL6699423.1 TIR domain-containing protein [Sphingomonas caseinilyticus]
MSDVFVSYKAEDRQRVRPLVEALQADGLSVWWDANIGAGDEWRESIATNLNQALCVIVIWSKRSTGPEGRFVRDEAARAAKRQVYVPVTIDRVDPPLGFGETQCLPLTGWKGNRDDPRYLALLDAARHTVGGDQPLRTTSVEKTVSVDRRGALAGGAVVSLAAAGGLGWWWLGGSPANANSVAVLPFANLSGDPAQSYFSDGMAEELRSALARISGLKVIGRTSSELLRDADAMAAAKKLAVGTIVTGSVRRSPSTIRVSAQLVDGNSGVERWTQTFDRPNGDVLQIQTSIAEAVAQQLRSQLGDADRKALTVGGTQNAAAQDLVLKADANPDGSKDGLLARVALYDAAIALDPQYAMAYAGKANATTSAVSFYASTAEEMQTGLDAAAVVARKAVSLAPDLADAHFALGLNRTTSLDFTAGWAEYQRAIASPGCSSKIMVGVANFLGGIGLGDDAATLWSKAQARDPLDPSVARSRAYLLSREGKHEEAIPLFRKLLADSPTSTAVRNGLATTLFQAGNYAEAERVTDQLPHEHPNWFVIRSAIAARTGNRARAAAILADMRKFAGDSAHYQYAEILAQLGDREGAIAELEAALKVRDPGLMYLPTDQNFESIRGDPRFAAIVTRLKFPKA